MNTNKETNQMADVKIVLAALWIAHFLLWTFGDMLSLLQKISEPVDNELIQTFPRAKQLRSYPVYRVAKAIYLI